MINGLRRVDQGGDLELTYSGVIVDSFLSSGRYEAVDISVPGSVGGPGGQSQQEGTLVITAHEPGAEKEVWSGLSSRNLGGRVSVDGPQLLNKAESMAKKIARAFPR